MYPMQNKTPEEKKAIAAKIQETRRANRKAREDEHQERIKYAGALGKQIFDLENRLAKLQRMETFCSASSEISGASLLRAEDIAAAARPWKRISGVYFLVEGDEVVYVGQSVDVFSRIGQHVGKSFTGYAFIPCGVDALDNMESLYIHFLQPRLNGKRPGGAYHTPVLLSDLLGSAPKSKRQTRQPLQQTA